VRVEISLQGQDTDGHTKSLSHPTSRPIGPLRSWLGFGLFNFTTQSYL
jgi:hypothetical protein